MSDSTLNHILAALERVETRLGQMATHEDIAKLREEMATRDDLTKLRVDLMARMDKHADQLTQIRDDIAVVSRQAAGARDNNETIRKDVQYLVEQAVIMERQIQRLGARVASLENGSHPSE